jgi:DNA recombination protein RmuC
LGAEERLTLNGVSPLKRRSHQEFRTWKRNLAEKTGQVGVLEVSIAKLQETRDQEHKQADEKVALLVDARERMKQEFKLLAEDVMRLHGENFKKQNKEQIETVLTPLREKLAEFQQGIKDAHTESVKDHATLVEQIRHLTDSSAKMTTETSSLTRALRGEAQTQGAWGEMILASILEKSGLREGEEYVAQESQTTEDGQRIRPDVPLRACVSIDISLGRSRLAAGVMVQGRRYPCRESGGGVAWRSCFPP